MGAIMADLEARLNSRQKAFMQVPDIAEVKKRRGEHEEELRKSRRYDLASKRRNLIPLPDSDLLDLSSIQRMLAEGAEPLQAASGLRKLLSIKIDPPIQQVIDAGLLPQLMAWLQRSDSPALQYEACWALTNIASGSHGNAEALVLRGVVPLIYALLESSDADVREQAAWLTGNITGDSAQLRDVILQTSGLGRLLKVMGDSPRPSLAKVTIWAVSNLCRGKPAPEYAVVRLALPYLSAMILGLEDKDVLKDCLWAISKMCEGEESRIQDLMETGLLPRLVVLAGSEHMRVQHPALRCIGNVAAGSETQTEKLVAAGVLNILANLLKSPKPVIRKEAAWISSNISVGPTTHIQTLLLSPLFPTLLSLLPTESPEVQTEILYALTNTALSELSAAPLFLLQQGTIAVAKQVLDTSPSPKVLQSTLELVKALLAAGKQYFLEGVEGRNKVCEEMEKAGLLAKLEELQKHPNEVIYRKAVWILEHYFETEEQSDLLISSILAVPLEFQM